MTKKTSEPKVHTLNIGEAAYIFERGEHWLRIFDYKGILCHEDGTPVEIIRSTNGRREFTAEALDQIADILFQRGAIRSIEKYRRIKRRIEALAEYHRLLEVGR